MTVIKIEDLDISEIQFCEKRSYGMAKKIRITYNKKALTVQLPKYRTSFRLNDKYGLSLVLNITDENIINIFKNLEEKLLIEAEENSSVWFNDEKSHEILKENMNPILKMHEKFDPQIKIKCNENYMTIVDKNQTTIKFENQNIKPGDEIRSIMSIDGVYILNNGTFGYILRMKTVMHYSTNDDIKFCDF